ncbi:carbonyl reductase [NADPH] 1-like protein [Jimgerdemannia flammicorona]|uniref:Carbonyl reductase [NADPH] 1-like protein n=1 Tax=Jimgerdemannia flammicorona TaxID=994334 RepID=A0A433QDL2_9FUNG|nr:carbonyl reductase [NADPH] 1-like protein [Jimgerdemannia flammicorona]
MSSKVAIVTGANKGIGQSLVRRLALEHTFSSLTIYLTARDAVRGERALRDVRAALEAEGAAGRSEVRFATCDVADVGSIRGLRSWVEKEVGGVDILVNNAGIGDEFHGLPTTPSLAEETIRINYYGLLNMCETFLPILRPSARIVNLSSGVGKLYNLGSRDLEREFRSKDLSVERLNALVDQFVDDVRTGTYQTRGWPGSWPAYSVSKIAVIALTGVLAHQLVGDPREIAVHVCDPGWTRTDMGGETAPKSADQGAQTPIFLALSPEASATSLAGNGRFWGNNRVTAW